MKEDRSLVARRKRLLRSLRERLARPGWRRSRALRWVIGIGLTLVIAALFPSARSTALSGYTAGSLWTNEDVTAPFTFPVYKEGARYHSDVRTALDDLKPVYLPDTNAEEASTESFRKHWNALISLLEHARVDSLGGASLLDSAKALGLSADEWNELASVSQAEKEKEFDRSQKELSQLGEDVVREISAIEAVRLISEGTPEEHAMQSSVIALRTKPTEETLFPKDSLLTVSSAANRIYAKTESHLNKNAPIAHAIAAMLPEALVPNVHYSAPLTDESRAAIVDRVPHTDGLVVEGEKIVEKGEILTPHSVASLESLSKARIEQGGRVAALGRIAGTVGHAGLIVMLIVLYLKFIRRKIYNDNAQILLMALVLLFPAVLAYLSVWVPVDFPLQYFILIPASSMLLTVLFDSRTGFYGTVAEALIVAGIRGNDYSIALAGLCAGAFAAYTVRDLRNRAQLFTSIGYIFIGYLVAIVALSLEQGTPVKEAGFELVASLGNALVSPVITLAFLYAIELIFDTTSDLRLIQFDNVNHPLLRELALRAPGTYQHTMLVAQLAEHAAIAIGANPLLAKIGAYYHDIGKLSDPQSFIENQSGEHSNIHDALSAWDSAERVKSHVAEGTQLARVHGLPQRIIDFIPMHHGTLHISFFYQRAVMEAAGNGSVDEAEFRYPGPRPNSKETVIVMLADAAEAIARSLARKGEEMTLETIDAAIEQLIRMRFDQGQFDQSDITVRDFWVVRSVFARHLTGLHHPRIPYPAPRESELSATTLAVA